MSNKLAACQALLDGFHQSLSDETIEDLHDQYQLKHSSSITLKIFKARELRPMILNRLLDSEYNELFTDLSTKEMSILIGITPKDYSSYMGTIHRKLSSLLIKGHKANLEDMKVSMEELDYVSKSDDLEHPDD